MSMILAMMKDTATIKRVVESVSATSGGLSVAWSNASTGNVCAIQADNSSEGMEYARDSGNARFRAYFAYGTDIKAQDRVVPETGLYAGQVLAVDGPPIDHGGLQDYVYVPLRQIKGGGTL